MSNHLDMGFTGFTKTVVNEYFDEYFPTAIEAAQQSLSHNLTYKYMTHSYLVSLYLDCPPNMNLHCPNQTSINNFLLAVNKGYIWWHSFPFNSNLGGYDKPMLEFGIKLSSDLSLKYNSTKSTVISQRDVPGVTRSIIPILKSSHIRALSIGANQGSAPPNVPSIFKWIDTDDTSNKTHEIIGMMHKGGYGGTDVNDCIIIPKFNHSLMMAWNPDNQGPPGINEVLSWFDDAKTNFPNATNIFASTFDNFLDALYQRPDIVQNLPVYNNEMGDTWEWGIASDPLKLAMVRSAQRERTKCIENSECRCDLDNDYEFYNFSRLLLKNFEHTWGGSVEFFLHPGDGPDASYFAWSNDDFYKGLNGINKEWYQDFINITAMWNEQRDWGLYYAMNALAMSNNSYCLQLYNNILNEWNILQNVTSPLESNDWVKINNISDNLRFDAISTWKNISFLIGFDFNNSGAINTLYDIDNDIHYASPNNLFGEIIYQTLTEMDFDVNIGSQYAYLYYDHVDFGKYKLDEMCKKTNVPKHQYISTKFDSFYTSQSNVNKFLLKLDFGKNEFEKYLMDNYGIPKEFYIEINFDTNTNSTFSMNIIWINKTVTRMPESIFLKFNPIKCNEWKVEKINKMLSVDNNVMINGTFHSHAFTNNITCNFSDGSSKFINIISKDSGLSVFEPKYTNVSSYFYNQFTSFPTPFDNISYNNNSGVAYLLYNNIWGTNYIQWYPFNIPNDQNSTFRFNIILP
eukprot:441446_1